jgi:hypothetical protein
MRPRYLQHLIALFDLGIPCALNRSLNPDNILGGFNVGDDQPVDSTLPLVHWLSGLRIFTT